MTIKEIIQKLHITMTDASGQESHFESWLTLNEGICDAIDALKALDKQEPTYTSTQATNCAGCGEHKHTPLRIDAMGGYVCLTCIDKKLSSLLGEFGYEQPEQEPVAVRYDFDGYGYQYIDSGTGSDWQTRVKGEPLYTAPQSEKYPQIAINSETVGYVAPQRTWVGLTDEERQDIALEVPIDAVLITEAKLKDKNTQKTTGENNLS
jgi:hypothetical protein